MGTPIEPLPPTDPCALCWDVVGSPFGTGPPPSSIQVSISGIQKGLLWLPGDGEPPSGVYTLSASATCSWNKTGPPDYFLQYLSGQSRMIVLQFLPLLAFFSEPFSECVKVFGNELTDPALWFYGGTVTVLV